MKRNYFKYLWLLVGLTALWSCGGDNASYKIPTDYSAEESWIELGTDTQFDVDVFYLYPTVWVPREEDGFYCGIDHPSLRENAPDMYASQAKVLEEIANVYVPWYRQGDALQLLGMPLEKMEEAVGKYPYEDAVAAFEYYLEHYNQGKPFILAGHSQGAIVIKLLLEDYMKEHPEVLKRMVAAYPLGFSFERSYFDRNRHLKFAEGETDTGVIATWNCERKADGKFGKFNYVCFPGALAINPVTWKHNTLKAEADDERFLESKNFPGLKCSVQVQYDPERKYEVLILGVDTDEYDREIIGDQNLHMMDFNLFTENIKVNAQKRIDAFLKQQK